MNKLSKIAGAAAAATLVAIGGSAFTASNTVVASVAGYGQNDVTGAVTTAIVHTLSGDGSTIASTKITFQATQTGRTVVAGFGTTALESCTVATDGLSATCAYASGYTTSAASKFNVAVS